MRRSKEDWLKMGITVLGGDGLVGLTIERIACDLQLTKGSYYHHFANMAGYKDHLIAYWAD